MSTLSAQVSTRITSDGSLGTIISKNGRVYNISGGARPGGGGNLFHSFGVFSIGAGDTGNFVNKSETPTNNIIGRVTGGQISNIFGTIQTIGFQGANLFLMNPTGIVFGPNASLNVNGSVHFTTADVLILSDGVQFPADPGDVIPVLTSAPVETFGFSRTNPASIQVNQSSLTVPAGETLSLVGGNIELIGGTFTAPRGQIALASLGSPGTVTYPLDQPLQVNAIQHGEIGLSGGTSINTDGETGGTVIIRGNQLIMDKANISANTTGSIEDSLSDVSGRGIFIDVLQDIFLDNSSAISANVLTGSTNGGNIKMKAGGNIEIRGGVFDPSHLPFITGVQTLALGGSGNAGDIEIDADKLLISSDLVGIQSISFPTSTGNSGNIHVKTNNLKIAGSGVVGAVLATVTLGAGEGGNVEIDVVGGDISLERGGLSASTTSTGKGGNVSVHANNLRMSNGATVQTGVFGPGNGGTTNIFLTGDLDISSGSFVGSLVDVNCLNNCGTAGDFTLIAKNIDITGVKNALDPLSSPGFTGIRTRSVALPGGNVFITADNLTIKDNGLIRTAALNTGQAGDIAIKLNGTFRLFNGGRVLADTTGTGNAGKTSIVANSINLQNSSLETKSTSTGLAGNINLTSNSSITLSNSSVTAEATISDGGNIKLTAPGTIRLVNSHVTTSVGGGPSTVGGNINIDPQFVILQNSQVMANAFQGQGGNISITTDALLADAASVIDASSQFGVSGTVTVQSPTSNISQALSPLPESVLSAAALLRAHCAARKQGGDVSSFTEQGRDAVPTDPRGIVPSPLLLNLEEAGASSKGVHLARNEDSKGAVIFEKMTTEELEQYLMSDLGQVCSS